MSVVRYLGGVGARLFRRQEVAEEMDEELRSHIAHRADDLERTGMDRGRAERRARVEFGARERVKEESYREMGGSLFATIVHDLRVSMRVLRKSPGFTLVAVLTLALAIGANAVVFSVMNALILRPLNVPNAQSLYMLERGKDRDGAQSYPDYVDLRDRNRSFDALAAYDIAAVGLDTGQNPSRAWAVLASGNFFDALGLHPYLGHFFHTSDEHGANSAPYIVLTYAFWHTRFHDDRSVVGRVVRVDKHPYTILGVAEPGFHGTLLFFNPDFFVPLVNQGELEGDNNLNARGVRGIFSVMGHLKAGVTPGQAIADLNGIGKELERAYPKDDSEMTFILARPSFYGDFLGPPVRAFLGALMLLAGLILLGACANLGSLFAARAADRSKEVALRLALGSTRRRILRCLFTEALLISVAGGGVGLAGSVALLRGLSSWWPVPRWPIQVPVNPDTNVYLVALLLTLASGFLFGAVPVRQVLRTNPYEVVKAGSITTLGRRITLRDLLLVVQIAICAVLVTSSMVAVRGLLRSLHSDFGFDPRNSLMLDTDLTMAGYPADKVPAMQKRMIEALEGVPGVESVGLIDQPPLADGWSNSIVFRDQTTDLKPANAAANPILFNVSPGYLHAAGTALLAGRDFTWHDEKGAPAVAVINQQFARKFFGSAPNALGKYFKRHDGTRMQVVGVAEDGKYMSFSETPQLAMFFSILQSPSSSTYLVVHSNRDPLPLAAAMKDTLRNLDAGLPVNIQTRYRVLDANLFASRMATISLGVLGVMGAMLAITGIFGMAAYSVSKRLRELGIRVALGAKRAEVLRTALGRALKLLSLGSAAGLALGLLATKVLAFIVYDATPRDPLVLAGVVVAMSVLGLLATWIPAQRALSVDPQVLLREE